MPSSRPSPSRLLVVALSAACGAVFGLFAGDLLRDEPASSSRSTPTGALPQERSPASGEPVASDVQAQRIDELEARLAALRLELEGLRSAPTLPLQGQAALPTGEEFRKQYEGVITAIIDRDRLNRQVASLTNVLYGFVRFHGESDAAAKEHDAFLRDVVAEYMQRQKSMVEDLAPTGAWPVQGDPTYEEWVRRWIELRGWLRDQLGQVLNIDSAARLHELIVQSSYLRDW